MDLEKLLKLAEQYEKFTKPNEVIILSADSKDGKGGTITTSSKQVVIDGDLIVNGTVTAKPRA